MNHALHQHNAVPDYGVEDALSKRGVCLVAGVDEAGRGCLAGPVIAAAVVLPRGARVEGINDSKQLRSEERDRLYGVIRRCAVAFGVGIASSREVDMLNVWRATCLAARRALASLPVAVGHVLMDGPHEIPDLAVAQTAIPKGDMSCASIAAASIVAKVRRDRIMCYLDRRFPGYGLATHKGYATEEHRRLLRVLGPCAQHRLSFSPIAQLELW